MNHSYYVVEYTQNKDGMSHYMLPQTTLGTEHNGAPPRVRAFYFFYATIGPLIGRDEHVIERMCCK